MLLTLGVNSLFAQFQAGTVVHVSLKGGLSSPYSGGLELKSDGVSCRYSRVGKYHIEEGAQVLINSKGGGLMESIENSTGRAVLNETVSVDGKEYSREIRYEDGYPVVTSSSSRHPLEGGYYLDLMAPYPRLAKDQSVSELAGQLRDKNMEVRADAAYALGQLGPAGVPTLCDALQNQDSWWVRDRAARALGAVKDPRAVPALHAALKAESRQVRRSAAWALSQIRDITALEPLIAAMGDKDQFVQYQIAKSLENISGQTYGNDQAKWQAWYNANKPRSNSILGHTSIGFLVILAAAITVALGGLIFMKLRHSPLQTPK